MIRRNRLLRGAVVAAFVTMFLLPTVDYLAVIQTTWGKIKETYLNPPPPPPPPPPKD